MATSKDNVQAAFARKKPERVPAGICLGGSWPFFVEGVGLNALLEDAEKAAKIYYEVNARVDADWVTVGTGATAFLIEALGGKSILNKRSAPEIEAPIVKTEEDIERLDIAGALKKDKLLWLKDVAAATVRINGGERSIFVSGRAPFTLAGQLLGLEIFSKSLYKNKGLVEKILNFAEELSFAYYSFMLEVDGIDGIFIADPSASGDVVSTKHFEAVVVPALTNLVTRLAPYKKPVLLHICGNITDRLHTLPQTGIDMISVDSKVDLAKAKEILAGRIALAGNVNPVYVIEERTDEEVYAESTRCLNAAAVDGGFLLLPGCDLSAKAGEENVRALVRAAHDWRG